MKAARKAPAQVAAELGQWLVENGQIVSTFNAVQGFLNLSISDAFWLEQLHDMAANEHYGDSTEKRGLMMVEYSSPNTNKPLHLGHVRNNLLGYSIAQIQQSNNIRLFQIAKRTGCKFSFGSDAHTMRHQQQFKNFYVVAGILNLTEDDLCDFVRG